jgi:hypothetical protein
MPKRSERRYLIFQLDYIAKLLVINGKEKSSELKDVLELRAGLSASRFLNGRTTVPKSNALAQMLFLYPEDDFKQIVRMNKDSFTRLVDLIKTHAIFHSTGRHKQHPVWVQLMVVLSRLGCDGNGASVGRNSRLFGVSYGSVCEFTNRVFTALLSMKDTEIYWPSAVERAEISRRFGRDHGLPGAVGVVDGTYVNMSQKPAVNGEVYFNRKSRYAMNVQLICDDRRRIIYYQLGWPGSVYDSTVFAQSSLFLNPWAYFSQGEYLLADSGYRATYFVCTPYRQPAANIPHNKVFNELFSSARVVIEHVNGIVKGRFSSLRGIRVQLNKEKDVKRVNEWILVCLILHNILVRFRDEWEEEDVEDVQEEELLAPNVTENTHANDLRLNVQQTLLTWFAQRR